MINFDENTHTYTDEGGKQLISVTTLLKQAGITPNYDYVNQEVLQKAAERGTLVHKEIEDYIKKGEIGFTTELKEFINYIQRNKLKVIASEKVVYNDVVAGTIDLIVETEQGSIIYVDFKTTSTIHKQGVSWQTSMYKDLDSNQEQDIRFSNATLQVWHFASNGELTVKDLPEVSKENIYKLYDNVRNGTVYVPTLEENMLTELYNVEEIIAHYENEKAKAEQKAKLVREKLMQSMKDKGITKFENDRLTLTYIAPSSREIFDGAKFKKDYPELASQYTKTSTTNEQIRIKLKEKKQDE